MTIEQISITLLDPNYLSYDAYEFIPGMGYNWGARIYTYDENNKLEMQTWADLDVFLNEWVNVNWDNLSFDVQHYIMDFIEPVYKGEYKYFPTIMVRKLEFTRKGEEA